jgi:hypothetical protein
MRRREFIALLGSGVTGWRLAARAQQSPRNKQVPIGFLAAAVPTPEMLSAFRDALRERGYVEGQNLSIPNRWPQGALEQISDVAAELVRSKCRHHRRLDHACRPRRQSGDRHYSDSHSGNRRPGRRGRPPQSAACWHRAQSQQSSRDLRAAGSKECHPHLDTGGRRRRR